VLRRQRIDPLGRQLVLELAAGRIAIGIGALLATRPALKALGFSEPRAGDIALGRMAGARDLALGLLTLAARDERSALRTTALVGAGADATDAVVFALSARHPDARRAGLAGAAAGGIAAIAGAWAWRRLGRR
jgi:hypothetical protein